MIFIHSQPSSPLYGSLQPWKCLLRLVLWTCVGLLTCLNLFNVQYVQITLGAFEIDALASLLSVNQRTNQRQSKLNVSVHSFEIPLIDKWNELPCLVHPIVIVNASSNRMSDPNQTTLKPLHASTCSKLKRNWLHNAPLSRMAKHIDRQQRNCSAPVATHYFDNTFGLGAHLVLWGQAMCNALQTSSIDNVSFRIQSRSPETWLWLDQTHCSTEKKTDETPLSCYFPMAEHRCDKDPVAISTAQSSRNISDPRNKKLHCTWVQNPQTRSLFRAAATEYLFQEVSPLVIQEAKRQASVVFASNNGIIPDDLITVHIRWGDKFWEMDLPPIEEYIEAVHNLTMWNGTRDNNETERLNIYLATEDPKAYEAFMLVKPKEWIVYSDITLVEINAFRPIKGNRASWATRNTKGRAGLLALGSLLVAMEANLFVLTTKSNWSTLMNHLRTNIIDPRCKNCTRMIDLRPGEYY